MKYIRRIIRSFALLLLLVVALAAGAGAVLTLTAAGRENLAAIISNMASTPDSGVAITGISGIWSGPLRVESVVLSDKQGAWLAVRGVAVEWSLLPLLSSRFEAELVHADRVELARLPQPSEEDTGEGGLPVSLAIERIDLPEIAIGGQLAGEVAQISAAGSLHAEAEPLTVLTDLKLSRSDGKQGVLDAKVDFAPGQDRLAVDIHGSEPAGGIIANFLKLPGAPPVDVAVSGTGPAANWNVTGTFSVDGKIVTKVAGRRQLVDKGNRIEAKGEGTFEQFVPATFQSLITGPSSFDFAGTISEAGAIDVERAALQTSALTATAKGLVDPQGASDFALDVVARATPPALSFGEGDGAVTISVKHASVRALGSGDAPMLDASVSIDRLTTAQAEFTAIEAKLHSDGFDIRNQTGPLSVSATAESGGSADETIAGLLAGGLKLDAAAVLAADTVQIESGAFASDTVNANLSGDVSLADGSLKLDVKASLLTALLPEGARPLLDKHVAVAATVSRDAAGAIRLDAADLQSGAFDAKGTIAYAPDALDVKLTGGYADVSKLSPDATGAIGFEISATGSPQAPDIVATISSEKLAAAGREIVGLVFSASGKADLANPAANVSIKGTVAGEALVGEAILKTSDGVRRIDGLSLTIGANSIKGDLALDETWLPEGSLALVLPDIGPLAALALDKAEGQVEGTVDFTRKGGVPQLAVNAKAASLVRGDLSVKGAEIVATIANYVDTPVISGKIKALSVLSGATWVQNVEVSLTQDAGWTGFSGGATVNGIAANAVGRVAVAAGTTTVELTSGLAKMAGLSATVARPTTLVVRNGNVTLDKFALAVSGGSVQVSGTAGSQLNLDAQVSALPAAVVNSFAPSLGATGTISGTARVSGPADRLNIGYSVSWKNAQTSQSRDAGFGAMSITADGTFSGGVVKFTANVGDGSGLGLKGGGSVDTVGRRLSLDFAGQVPFGFLTRRLAAQGLALSGTSNVKLAIRGALGAPAVSGSISTSGARLVDARSGLAVNGLSADIDIANGAASIRRLDGTLSSGGSLSASGTVGIDATKGFPADLSMKIVDARYTDGRIVTTNLSGDLALKGPLTSQPLLSGTINLAKTVITIPERLPGSIAALGVKHKNATAAVRQQSEAILPASAEGKSGTGLTLDITVNAPQQIFVRGRGLDAELGGSIRLTGPLAEPRAVGQFTLRRGRLSLLSRRLNFTRGTVGFAGSLVPTIDFAAESPASDATVTVSVSGQATNPKFGFSSSPTLPEDEILARLVFGRSLSNLSPLQIAQLADAAAQLAGGGGSTSLLNTLRSKIGVDDLDIKTDAEGKAAVSAGKYLNDRTYVTIEKGEKAGSGKATIDLDIGRGVKLRGEAGADGKAKGGIFFEREY